MKNYGDVLKEYFVQTGNTLKDYVDNLDEYIGHEKDDEFFERYAISEVPLDKELVKFFNCEWYVEELVKSGKLIRLKSGHYFSK